MPQSPTQADARGGARARRRLLEDERRRERDARERAQPRRQLGRRARDGVALRVSQVVHGPIELLGLEGDVLRLWRWRRGLLQMNR